LSADNIKFYSKIHFNRDRSDNKLNMHCHLIVSRKDTIEQGQNKSANQPSKYQERRNYWWFRPYNPI
jgi:hypothetical protein